MGAVLIEVRDTRCPQAVVSFLMWVMGVEPETSGRAVDTLNHENFRKEAGCLAVNENLPEGVLCL